MTCNCNNTSENQSNAILPHVFGNVMRLAIPLTLRTVEGSNGEITTTDTDFIPSSNYPVVVEFSKGAVKINVDAVMRDGNVAYIEDKGTIPVGTYAITISCKDDNGNPYRFKQDAVLNVVDLTRQAGITPPAEYEVGTQYLDSAVYLALKGEDGVGVQDITIQTSGEVGGANRVTFILTDGREKSFDVLNGSGAVDFILNTESSSPIANKTVAAKFNQIESSLENVFGDVDYDSVSKSIRFYAKDKPKTSENILVSLDARPFIKDGMVNSVYISNNTLVITFNTDSGREAIGVPLTSVFNPNNYYNKTQIDNRIAQAIASVQVDTSGLAQLNQVGIVKYNQAPKNVLDFIDNVGEIAEEGYGTYLGASNGHIYYVNESSRRIDLGLASDQTFYDKNTEAFYRWTVSSWQKVSSGGGINATYDSTNERLIFPAGSAVVVNERLIIKT